MEIDDSNKGISIEEKPDKPKTNWAVTGLYIYDHNASSYAKSLKKSNRGEFEITDINLKYLENKSLNVEFLNKEDISWLDTGTFDSLLEASNFIKNALFNLNKINTSNKKVGYLGITTVSWVALLKELKRNHIYHLL